MMVVMPYRDPTERRVKRDAVDHLDELYTALDHQGAWDTVSGDIRPALWLAAVVLSAAPGAPDELARATRGHYATLVRGVDLWAGITPPLQVLIAAQMIEHDDDPTAYMAEVERVWRMFRAAALRDGKGHEYLAVQVLRRTLGRAIEPADVSRFGAIYEAMKRHHWWLTGPDDLLACATLVGLDEQPAVIGAGADEIYQALRGAGVWAGDALQGASHTLYLAGTSPTEICERLIALRAAFRARDEAVDLEELAFLCLLARPIEAIVELVLTYHRRMLRLIGGPWGSRALGLAVDLAFFGLAVQDPKLAVLADAKLLLSAQRVSRAQGLGWRLIPG